MLVNALSVDVEEYYHAAIFRTGARDWIARRVESRVERSVDRLLALLREHRTHATFFILGEVAAAHPAVVHAIVKQRHEVACHGDRNEDVSRQTRPEFRADIFRAKARLEALVCEAVIGYPAPHSSIRRAPASPLEIL